VSKARVIFMGTPDYAVPALMALATDPRVEIPLVVTQPDRPQGRGRKLQSPPVRLAADDLGLQSLQVSTLRSDDARALLESAEPELIVVAAFGIILGPRTLNLPGRGCVNLHASLLPRYRGANPIAAAIAMGEQTTGVTLMRMDRGLDTGPILATRSAEIDPTDTTATLTDRLAMLGSDLLIAELGAILDGSIEPQNQPPGATLTRPMKKDDGWIDWHMSTREIDCHVRAMIPWPRAWTTLPDGTRLLVHQIEGLNGASRGNAPGCMAIGDGVVCMETGDGSVILHSAQLPGGRYTQGKELARIFKLLHGSILGSTGMPPDRAPLVTKVQGNG
jgi:methionyl-tRNA formyltransferase